jgi:hypothetical protein
MGSTKQEKAMLNNPNSMSSYPFYVFSHIIFTDTYIFKR